MTLVQRLDLSLWGLLGDQAAGESLKETYSALMLHKDMMECRLGPIERRVARYPVQTGRVVPEKQNRALTAQI